MHYQKSGQFPVSDVSVTRALATYGITDFSYQHTTSGIENTTLLISTSAKEDYVLRVYRAGHKQHTEIMRELDFMKQLHDANLPVPRIHANLWGELLSSIHHEDATWQVVLMQHMPGRHAQSYTDQLIDSLAVQHAHMHLLGERYAQQHRMAANDLIVEDTEFLPNIAIDRVTEPDAQSLFERSAAYSVSLDATLPHGLCHLDYDTGNVLVDDTGNLSAILDFDDLSNAPLMQCLAYTLWHVLYRTDSLDAVRQYIATYETVRRLTPSERSLLLPVMLARHYSIAALTHLDGRLRGTKLAHYLSLETLLRTHISDTL